MNVLFVFMSIICKILQVFNWKILEFRRQERTEWDNIRLFLTELLEPVVSNNDGRVVARSAEAKFLGIPIGEPLFPMQKDIRDHGIVVFSSNYELYADISARMMVAIASIAPRIEEHSLMNVLPT